MIRKIFYLHLLHSKGILGLAYSKSTREATVFENMYSQGLIREKKFSFWLSRDLTQDENGGQLFFGTSNPQYYIGNLTYVPVSQKGFWQFDLIRF